ncbi:unnamed protein product, partial [Phaeothamnion confervicola]
CFSLPVGGYTYEMCPYGEARQNEGSGTGGVSLGRWKRLLTEDPARAAAAAEAPRCWNGPARSLRVQLHCGAAEKVLSVEEPETCSYVMEFATP